MPLIIGITGAIAAGKSTACRLLVERGAHHCDADRLVHRLYDPGTDAFDRIVGIFGEEIVGDDGYIDRRVLGRQGLRQAGGDEQAHDRHRQHRRRGEGRD